MRIEEPVVLVKAEFDNEETMRLNSVIEILSILAHEMAKRNLTECICEEHCVMYEEIIQASEVLETLTLLSEIQ